MSWEPINLRDVSDEPPEPPEYGGLVYRRKRHWFSGEPESCKTIISYAIAIETIRGEELVALIDFEMGSRDSKKLLREMGMTDDEFDLLDFYESPGPPSSVVIKTIIERGTKLVILDAAAGAFQASGLSENYEAEKFNDIWIQPLWKEGLTTIVLDHVVKNPDNRGMYASGHHRKVGGADVHLGFSAVKKLRRGFDGIIAVTAHKDRPGFHKRKAGEIALKSDPETHAISWEWKPETSDATAQFRPTYLMERVSRYVEQTPANRAEIKAQVKGKSEYIVPAIKLLLDEGYMEEIVRGAKGTKIRSTKPFRDERSHRSPVVPDRSGNVRSTNRSHRSQALLDAGTKERSKNGNEQEQFDVEEIERLAQLARDPEKGDDDIPF